MVRYYKTRAKFKSRISGTHPVPLLDLKAGLNKAQQIARLVARGWIVVNVPSHRAEDNNNQLHAGYLAHCEYCLPLLRAHNIGVMSGTHLLKMASKGRVNLVDAQHSMQLKRSSRKERYRKKGKL